MINISRDNISAVGSIGKLMGTSLETQKVTDETIKLKFQMYIEKAVNDMRSCMNSDSIYDVLNDAANDVNHINMPTFVARLFS